MVDNRSRESRSALMSRIAGKDTKPELIVRRLLHGLGYRFRLHVKGLPGTPDLVFPRRKMAIFVHGCFWHNHGCLKGRPPKSRLDYWLPKLEANKRRDASKTAHMHALGWKTFVVWQCKTRNLSELQEILVEFLDQ